MFGDVSWRYVECASAICCLGAREMLATVRWYGSNVLMLWLSADDVLVMHVLLRVFIAAENASCLD